MVTYVEEADIVGGGGALESQALYPKDYTATMPDAISSAWTYSAWRPQTVTLSIQNGVVVSGIGTSLTALFNAKSAAITAPDATYYVATTGSDANDGLSVGAPFATLHRAVTVAKAAGYTKISIIASAGSYPRSSNPTNGGNVVIDIDTAWFASGGRVITGTWDNFTAPTVDPTYTNTYSYAVATAPRVFDLKTLDADGNYAELTNVATAAICNITPNSWTLTAAIARTVGITSASTAVTSATSLLEAGWLPKMTVTGTGIQANTTIISIAGDGLSAVFSNTSTATNASATVTTSAQIYIRRGDMAAVTRDNTRVYRSSTANMRMFGAAVNMYIGGVSGADGFDFEGSDSSGALTIIPNAVPASQKIVAVENCTMKYAGGVGITAARGVAVTGFHGLVILSNCTASRNITDGFNGHNDGAGTSAAQVTMVTVNCVGLNNGGTQVSCQNFTLHEDVVGADFASYLRDSNGGNIRNIGPSKMWAAGTTLQNDKGDLQAGGAVAPTAALVNDTSQLYLDTVFITQNAGYGLVAASGCAIYTRNMTSPRAPNSGAGTITIY